MNKVVGDAGEARVAALLRGRGYDVTEIGGNFPTIDLVVHGSSNFRVSVKTSASKRHVRLGTPKSVSALLDSDFVFAFMPKIGDPTIDLDGGRYDIWIVPGSIARADALWVHQTYLDVRVGEASSSSGNAGILVKSYSRRGPQVETWRRWEGYLDRWDVLPAP
jgi:hypothetical protein